MPQYGNLGNARLTSQGANPSGGKQGGGNINPRHNPGVSLTKSGSGLHYTKNTINLDSEYISKNFSQNLQSTFSIRKVCGKVNSVHFEDISCHNVQQADSAAVGGSQPLIPSGHCRSQQPYPIDENHRGLCQIGKNNFTRETHPTSGNQLLDHPTLNNSHQTSQPNKVSVPPQHTPGEAISAAFHEAPGCGHVNPNQASLACRLQPGSTSLVSVSHEAVPRHVETQASLDAVVHTVSSDPCSARSVERPMINAQNTSSNITQPIGRMTGAPYRDNAQKPHTSYKSRWGTGTQHPDGIEGLLCEPNLGTHVPFSSDKNNPEVNWTCSSAPSNPGNLPTIPF